MLLRCLVVAGCLFVASVQCGCTDSDTVYADCFGFNATDSTLYIQQAFNAPGSTIIIRKMASPWIVASTINFRQNTKYILFESGAVVTAKEGAFKATTELMFKFYGTNITLSGYGATLSMRKADYDNKTLYTHSEYRHLLSISGAKINILGLTFSSSGGDGIYASVVSDFYLKDVVCDNNYRNALTIISAVNFTADNCRFTNTWGSLPMAGVDLEPNDGTNKLENVVFRNCVMDGNQGAALSISASNINNTSGFVTVLIDNCILSNSPGALFVISGLTEDGPQKGLIELRNSQMMYGANFLLFRYFIGAIKILINNVNMVQQLFPVGSRPYPIYMSAVATNLTVGNLEFNCVNLTSPNPIPWLYSDATVFSSYHNIWGNIQLHMPNSTYCKPQWSPKLNSSNTYERSTNIALQCNGVGEDLCVPPPPSIITPYGVSTPSDSTSNPPPNNPSSTGSPSDSPAVQQTSNQPSARVSDSSAYVALRAMAFILIAFTSVTVLTV